MATLENNDFILVQRGNTTYKVQSSNLMAYLNDTDFILINRSNVTYKISGADVRAALGSGNPLDPSVPPFGGYATTATTLTSSDSKIKFSLDGTTYSSTLNVPLNTFYYVDWGTDILTAAHGSAYTAAIGVNFTTLTVTETVDINIGAIDKVPGAFSFTALIDATTGSVSTSETISPLETINAPTSIWASSTASNHEIRVGDGTFFTPPSSPGTAYVTHNEEIQVRHTNGTSSSTAYTTTLNIGYGTGSGEFESAVFSSTTAAAFISQPSITSPANNASLNIQTTAITGSAISGDSYGTHASTDWQIATDSNFTSILKESLGDTSNLTSWTPGTLTDSSPQTLYIRHRYIGSTGTTSPYSATVSINQFPEFNMLYLVIGGGGSKGHAGQGGNYPGYSGGGAGGYISSVTGESSGQLSSPVTPKTVTGSNLGDTYSVTVGAAGSDSTFSDGSFSHTALAGGNGDGGAGGSGGGNGPYAGGSTGGTGTSNQGFNGGNGQSGMHSACGTGHLNHSLCGPYNGFGGGGGAGGAGAAGGANAGNGGVGIASSITGTSVYYAGGGTGRMGNNSSSGTPGLGYNHYGGGQGDGASNSPTPAQPGAVIIRVSNSVQLSNITGNLQYTTTATGNDNAITFTSGTGTFQLQAV